MADLCFDIFLFFRHVSWFICELLTKESFVHTVNAGIYSLKLLIVIFLALSCT